MTASTEDRVVEESADPVVEAASGMEEDSGIVEEMTGAYEEDAVADETLGEDWETEAKKFQSMKDKAEAKLQDWERYAPLVSLLESRPDLVGLIQNNLNPETAPANGAQVSNPQEEFGEDEFNPWDAFFRPDSESYRHREAIEQNRVDETMQRHFGALQEQVFMNNLVGELKSTYNMSEEEATNFIDFYAQPKDQLSVDTLVDVFQRNNKKEGSKPSSSLDAVRASKSAPKTAGAVSSSGSIPRNETDKVFDTIVAADNKGRVF